MRYFVTLLLTACMIGTCTTVNAYMFSVVRGLIVPTVGVLMRIWANVIFMVLVCVVIFITFMALQPARAQEEDSLSGRIGRSVLRRSGYQRSTRMCPMFNDDSPSPLSLSGTPETA